jgi:hypothetical protein
MKQRKARPGLAGPTGYSLTSREDRSTRETGMVIMDFRATFKHKPRAVTMAL